MGFLIIDFPRLKGLYQMKAKLFPFWSAWDKVYSNSISAVSLEQPKEDIEEIKGVLAEIWRLQRLSLLKAL